MNTGIDIEQNKTGTAQVKEGPPRLRAASQLARNTFESGDCVIKGAAGNKASPRLVNEWWNKAKNQRDPDVGLRSDASSTISKSGPFLTIKTAESLNSVIRIVIKKRKVFPTDDCAQEYVKKWSMPIQNWRLAMSRFITEFGDRLSDHLQYGGSYTEWLTGSIASLCIKSRHLTGFLRYLSTLRIALLSDSLTSAPDFPLLFSARWLPLQARQATTSALASFYVR